MRREPPTHPTFKPLLIATGLEQILTQPHMKIEIIRKMIPAKDSWYPCFKEVRADEKWEGDGRGEFISGEVEVMLRPSYSGIRYANKFYVEKWTWKITILGNDDTGAEKYFDSKEDALAVYEALDVCPLRRTLLLEWNFEGY